MSRSAALPVIPGTQAHICMLNNWTSGTLTETMLQRVTLSIVT